MSKEKDLYEYVTLSDIEKINKAVSLQREKIIAPDGAANYMRPVLKEMDEETFELFVRYQMSVAERMDLMGQVPTRLIFCVYREADKNQMQN